METSEIIHPSTVVPKSTSADSLSSADTVIALQRFGFSARPDTNLKALEKSPKDWLKKQIKPLVFTKTSWKKEDFAQGFERRRSMQDEMKQAKRMAVDEMDDAGSVKKQKDAMKTQNQKLQKMAREVVLTTALEALETDNSFQFRLLDFFSNHFSVTLRGAKQAGPVALLEREAIAPHLSAKFADMLKAVARHPGMLMYLNNDVSIGPNSKIGKRRKKRGLNENLAREILELHTLGVDGGYTQQDVEELAKALTGRAVDRFSFAYDFRAHANEPGTRRVLSKSYAHTNSDQQADAILEDLAVHPATARFISFKLARHFIADEPPEKLVTSLTQQWLASGGDLKVVLNALIDSKEAFDPQLRKLKTPREFVIGACRALGASPKPQQLLRYLSLLGQRPLSAGSPAGFDDIEQAWGGGQAILNRVEWAAMFSRRFRTSPLPIAQRNLGALLSKETRFVLNGAESDQQGLALLLVSPEFMRR